MYHIEDFDVVKVIVLIDNRNLESCQYDNMNVLPTSDASTA